MKPVKANNDIFIVLNNIDLRLSVYKEELKFFVGQKYFRSSKMGKLTLILFVTLVILFVAVNSVGKFS